MTQPFENEDIITFTTFESKEGNSRLLVGISMGPGGLQWFEVLSDMKK